MIGFGDMSPDIAQLQEAVFVGGKKNDLVLCYGGPDPLKPIWARVFGWTDKTIVKANLQTILLGNPVDKTILPLIKQEVYKNYEIKEWEDFNYMEIPIPTWMKWVYIFAVIVIQSALWWWFKNNEFNKYD